MSLKGKKEAIMIYEIIPEAEKNIKIKETSLFLEISTYNLSIKFRYYAVNVTFGRKLLPNPVQPAAYSNSFKPNILISEK